MKSYFLNNLSSWLCLIVFAVMAITSSAAPKGEKTAAEAREFKGTNGTDLPYRLLKPAQYDPQKKYPLVLCLHGAGGRGDNNLTNLKGTYAYSVLSSDQVQKEHPAFLVIPQCPKSSQWVNTPWGRGSYSMADITISNEMHTVLEILDSVIKEFNVDSDRIYVTGQSMGGFGTWDIILRRPQLFAAAIPICGAGDPTAATSIKHLPIWAYHGDKDRAVPVSGSRAMIKALKKAGNSQVKYTELAGCGHLSWIPAWKNKELVTWLFEQSK